MVEHPAECVIFAPCIGNDAAAFRRPVALGIRNSLAFRGCIPTAHTLAYLRFAHAVTDTSARLATDPPGSALIGRVSHPLDDSSKFPEVIASFLSIGPASLGRTKTHHLTYGHVNHCVTTFPFKRTDAGRIICQVVGLDPKPTWGTLTPTCPSRFSSLPSFSGTFAVLLVSLPMAVKHYRPGPGY
jgi:hypothetical protein